MEAEWFLVAWLLRGGINCVGKRSPVTGKEPTTLGELLFPWCVGHAPLPICQSVQARSGGQNDDMEDSPTVTSKMANYTNGSQQKQRHAPHYKFMLYLMMTALKYYMCHIRGIVYICIFFPQDYQKFWRRHFLIKAEQVTLMSIRNTHYINIIGTDSSRSSKLTVQSHLPYWGWL